jgi:putative component of toxin-antitoxin plasmid stabilization module
LISAPVTGCISSREDGNILLAGGDKKTQADDIKAALRLARNLSE